MEAWVLSLYMYEFNQAICWQNRSGDYIQTQTHYWLEF